MKTEPKKSEQKIIAALTFAENQKLRWSDLVAKTELSKRALSQSLKSLQKQQRIRRIVDAQTEEYPPPVYYELINEAERRFAEKVGREWNEISERMNILFKVTCETDAPEIYLEEILKAILTDCVFTLHYAVEEPQKLVSLMLLEWHLRTHRELMAKTFHSLTKSKRFRQALKQIYEVMRSELEEKTQAYHS